MAIGLASMNPIPNSGAVMIQDKSRDKDLEKGFNNFSVAQDINSDKLITLDKKGKAIFRDSDELNEHTVAVYWINSYNADQVLNQLIQEAEMDEIDKPIHDSSYIYEAITGHKLLSEDQANIEPVLERVYLDKLSKKVNGIVDSFDSEVSGLPYKGKIDAHYPLEERPNGSTSEEDGSVKFPMLAHTKVDVDKCESILESILTGKGEEIVEINELGYTE